MRLARLMIVVSLLAQTGLPVALAQGLAWASMVAGGQTVAQAVEGRNPCSLCLRIKSAKSPHSMAARVVSPALDWHSSAARPLASVLVSRRFSLLTFRVRRATTRFIDPPPPRLLLS